MSPRSTQERLPPMIHCFYTWPTRRVRVAHCYRMVTLHFRAWRFGPRGRWKRFDQRPGTHHRKVLMLSVALRVLDGGRGMTIQVPRRFLVGSWCVARLVGRESQHRPLPSVARGVSHLLQKIRVWKEKQVPIPCAWCTRHACVLTSEEALRSENTHKTKITNNIRLYCKTRIKHCLFSDATLPRSMVVALPENTPMASERQTSHR